MSVADFCRLLIQVVLDLPICQSGEGKAAVGKREPEEHQGGRVQLLLNAVDNVGQTAILPASIIGTPRWYCGPGQPALVRGMDKPTFFPTLTRNHKWPDIVDSLQRTPSTDLIFVPDSSVPNCCTL